MVKICEEKRACMMSKRICRDCIHYETGEDGQGDLYCFCDIGNFEKLLECGCDPWNDGKPVECKGFSADI